MMFPQTGYRQDAQAHGQDGERDERHRHTLSCPVTEEELEEGNNIDQDY